MSSKKRKNYIRDKEKIIIKSKDLLFRYIKPQDNDIFSEMKGLDLQELLYYIDNYYLELRNRLGFDQKITFGLELEFEHAMQNRIKDKLNETFNSNDWRLKRDGSLDNGAEINSPILRDNSTTWKNLKKVCSIVSENAVIGKRAGGHIHIGTQVLGTKVNSYLNLLKLWSIYENIIYRFSYGNMLNSRETMVEFAPPIARVLWQDYSALSKIGKTTAYYVINEIQRTRYAGINFSNTLPTTTMNSGNTIEFRCPNATLDPVIWQNNVNLFVNILKYSSSDKFNDDILEERRRINKDKYYNLKLYNEIFLQQALEFCDMVFTNNLDKVYFLRQYLKSFEVAKENNEKAKQFTKK